MICRFFADMLLASGKTSAIVEGFAPRRCGCQEDCRCKKPRLDGGLEAECFWFFGSLGGVGARKFGFCLYAV